MHIMKLAVHLVTSLLMDKVSVGWSRTVPEEVKC